MAIFWRGPANGGDECRWGRWQSRFSTNIWLSDRWLLHCELRRSTVQFTTRTARHQRILFITTNMDDHDEDKRTERNFIVRSGKAETELTNHRSLRSTYCTIEATDRHEASRSLSATAGLLVYTAILWRNSNGVPLTGASNGGGGYENLAILTNISLYLGNDTRRSHRKSGANFGNLDSWMILTQISRERHFGPSGVAFPWCRTPVDFRKHEYGTGGFVLYQRTLLALQWSWDDWTGLLTLISLFLVFFYIFCSFRVVD